MSENIFSNFEQVEETNATQPVENQVQSPSVKPMAEPQIVSKDYDHIKPFYASTYGKSRLFTANYNGRKVIIKTLKAAYAQDAQSRKDLKKEYELTSELDHKFIRKALGFETIQGLGDCIILEYIDGKSLAEHVRVGTLNEKQIKNILVDLCDGLNYMHQRMIVHCDLKPENIIVSANDCRAKIIDIGLPETEYKTDRELLIKENEFIAPELIKGEECDPRSDVYSLGKIIEFISERDLLSQFSSVATHCTQFSREQRFDNIMEVRSLLTKGFSVVKIILLILLLAAVAVAAYIYVPKIIEKNRAEKAERLAVDFSHEMDKINAETNALCEKYKLVSLDEPLAVPAEWRDDSLRFCQQLAPFFSMDSLHEKAMQAFETQKQAIAQSRQHDFEALLMTEFRQAADSVAVQLKANVTDPSDSLMFVLANQWFQKTH
ncbi:MAG: serine/threonine protein kinase [Bacteroidales bacterium]|nr:serine/threonine protein kinase [Bacteroidales bacterium]